MKYNYQWLEHLKNAVPASGYGKRLSVYTISLEAWRRGIMVKYSLFENDDNKNLIKYSLSYNGRTHHFRSSLGDKTTEEAIMICKNKELAKRFMAKSGVAVPKGKRFQAEDSDNKIIEYASSLGYPLVLKPTSEKAGKGVFANISNEKILQEALIHVRNELGLKDVIVEEFISGEEHRILLVGNKIIGAVNRIPANIVGDGVSSIGELIHQKNLEKKKNPTLNKSPIELDNEVYSAIDLAGYTIDSIPKEGEQIFLRNKSNVSRGGEPIDVTDQLTDEIKQMAITAAESIPGLAVCGLDMIVDPKDKKGVIIEINTTPMLGLHLYPVKGVARDVTKEIIDFYFPETVGVKRSLLYFDMDIVLSPLKNSSAEEIQVSQCPEGIIYGKRFVVKGISETDEFRSFVREQALIKKYHGHTKYIENGMLEIIIAGTSADELENFKKELYKESNNKEIEIIEEDNYNKPVKIGFENIKDSTTRQTINKLRLRIEQEKANVKDKNELVNKYKKIIDDEREKHNKTIQSLDAHKIKLNKQRKKLSKIKKDYNIVISDRDNYKNEYYKIKQSRTWRYTQPLRKLFTMFKNK